MLCGARRRLGNSAATALEVFLWSRVALWFAAVLAFLTLVPDGDPVTIERDDPNVLSDLGFATDVWARWDSHWFIEIARHGYDVDEQAAAFYPLYPTLLAGLGRLFFGHYVVAGIVISLLAAAGAFVLLHGLAQRLGGEDVAFRTVLFLAVFPTSFFLSAVYSESLFLLLAVATFVLAERGRLAFAAAAAGLALLTRPTAVALVPVLAAYAWQSRDRLRAFASVAVAPAVFALFPLLLALQTGDAFRFTHVEDAWDRSVAVLGPLEGVYRGAQAAWGGVRQLLQGSPERWFWIEESSDRFAIMNIELASFFVLFSILTVVAWRRLGTPYGLFAAGSLAIATAAPTQAVPLLSLTRFGLVVFPFFIALALLADTPRLVALVTGVSALLLGVHLTQWVLWQWVA
jgi:hypothetical protein